MNSETVKSVWNRIPKIKRKDTSNTVHHLSVSDREVSSHRDIVNALANSFFHVILPLLSVQMSLHLS